MTATVSPTANAATKDRATRPGPSAARRLAFWGVFTILAATMAWGVYGLTSRPDAPHQTDPQSWLPRALDRPVDQVLVGTTSRPALTVEGDPVEVKTATFSALVVVHGPVVPGEGLPYQQHFVTSTWTVSLSNVRGTVPISLADFDSIDHQQTIYKPALVPGPQPLPATLHSGQQLSFKIRSVLPIGEGLLRWAPDGDHIVAKWDFQVEND
jgi:hypothetical protein